MNKKSGGGSSWLMPIASFVPAPILAWLNQWFDLLQGTGLAHPHWRRTANAQVVVVSILLVVIIFILCRGRSEQVLRRATIGGFIASVLALAGCALVRQVTNQMESQFDIEQWKMYWHITYVAMSIVWLGTVTTMAMYLAEHAKGQS